MFTPKELEAIQEHLDGNPVEVWWSHDDGLSSDQISAILTGDRDQVWQEIATLVDPYLWDQEKTAYQNALDDLFPDKELEVASREVLYFLQENGVYPVVDYEIGQLISQTNARLFVGLGIEHDYYARDYEEVETELTDLGMNPCLYRSEWPDIPDRCPLLSPDSLEEVWINCTSYSEWYALLDGSDVLRLFWEGRINSKAVLKAGAPITVFDFVNGSGSMFARTVRDIEIDTSRIRNDADYRYGFNACYGGGLDWTGELEVS